MIHYHFAICDIRFMQIKKKIGVDRYLENIIIHILQEILWVLFFAKVNYASIS